MSAAPPREELVALELALVRLIAAGCDTPQICRALGYSPRTVKNRIRLLCVRYGANNRPHLVALAIRSGLIA